MTGYLIHQITLQCERFIFWVNQGNDLHIRFFESKSFDPATLIYSLFGLCILILSMIYFTYRYQRYRRYQEFETEMRSLDLDPNSEGTLAFMVKRYAMDEPVKVLVSAQTFDSMAEKEMCRVLGSEGSQKSKEQFIDTLYQIRNKTFNPEWT